MKSIKNTILMDGNEISISHKSCCDPLIYKYRKFYFSSNSVGNDTITKIRFNDSISIYIHWQYDSFFNSPQIMVLYIQETGVLFIGCGDQSIQFSVAHKNLINSKRLSLIYRLSRHKEFVVETRELECFLYSLDGQLLDKAQVISPNEIEYFDTGIKYKSFDSEVNWLHFPN